MNTSVGPAPPSSLYEKLMSQLLHAVSRPPVEHDAEAYHQDYTHVRDRATQKFLSRFPPFRIEGRRILDAGSGLGNTCIELARRGAAEVVGVDIDEERIGFARARLENEPSAVRERVTFLACSVSDVEPGGGFDIIVSQDSFEHISEPEHALQELRALLSASGLLMIGFGPTWRSPWGGHIGYMTRLPYAHLIFPERVVMHERLRYRPEERATRYEEILGGLNRMTTRRFMRMMEDSGLEALSLQWNVGTAKPLHALRLLSRLPLPGGLAEDLFVMNIFGIWRERGSSATL